MSVAANAPSSAIKVSRHLNNPHTRIAEISPSEFTTGGGISIKQRLGIGALAPTNPKTGPPPPSKQASKPLPISHPSALTSLKIKKMTPSLSITTDVNPASGTHTWPESLGSAYDASMHSPQITANVSPNTTNLMPSTPVVPIFTQTFHRPTIPHGTMYVFLFNLIVYFPFLLLVRLLWLLRWMRRTSFFRKSCLRGERVYYYLKYHVIDHIIKYQAIWPSPVSSLYASLIRSPIDHHTKPCARVLCGTTTSDACAS